MKKPSLLFLATALLFVALPSHSVAALPLGQTQLREFFQWIKVDGNGLLFETKLHRGFMMRSELPRNGPAYFLALGTPLEMSYTTGDLKFIPKSDVNGPYFEAVCSDAVKFMPTTPRARYILRTVSTPQGVALDIEEEAGT